MKRALNGDSVKLTRNNPEEPHMQLDEISSSFFFFLAASFDDEGDEQGTETVKTF
jgi:hypothetical protein